MIQSEIPRRSTSLDAVIVFISFFLSNANAKTKKIVREKKVFCVLFEAAPKSISCLAVISGIRNKPRKTNRLQKLY